MRLLAESGGAAQPLAGGTDLVLQLERGADPARVAVDLKRIPELQGTRSHGGGWRFGALVRMAELERDAALRAACPALVAAAGFVGGPPIRNRATLAGNICNASPAADTSPALLALGATVDCAGPGGTRTLPLGDFWQGPGQTVLTPGELVTGISLPAPPGRSGNAFARLTRSAMDIALINAAAQVTLDERGHFSDARLALGACGPTVFLVAGLTEALAGHPWNEETRAAAMGMARDAARPIDDVRASADYRRDMAGVLAARCLAQAIGHATGEPAAGKRDRP
jgi:carbon-monoxide dehydrogenase medium subunit